MSLLQRLFGANNADSRERLRPLYLAIIAKGRELHWYDAGLVPDTLDGRFDMISSTLAMVLLRMEEIPDSGQDQAWLTELFVEDMDAQMRETGLGDVVIAKDIGKVMSILGGRLGAFRGAFDDEARLNGSIKRNIYEGETVDPAAHRHVAKQLSAFWQRLLACDADALIAGDIA